MQRTLLILRLKAYYRLWGLCSNCRKSGIERLFVFTDEVCEFLAAVHKHKSEILENGASAAELAVDFMDSYECAVYVFIRNEFYKKSVSEINTEIPDAEFFAVLCILIIGSDFGIIP